MRSTLATLVAGLLLWAAPVVAQEPVPEQPAPEQPVPEQPAQPAELPAPQPEEVEPADEVPAIPEADEAHPADEVDNLDAAARPDRPADLVLAVDGFVCDACTAKLEQKLSELEGAEAVAAESWEEGTVSVWLEPDAEVDDEALAAIVTDAGFVLKEVRRADPGAAL